MTDAPNPRPRLQRLIGVAFIAALVYYIIKSATSCAAPLPIVQVRDSVRVEVRERVVRDTAFITIAGDYREQTSKDTASVLESPYAVSKAAIREGELYHSLQTTPQEVLVPVRVEVRDTLVIRERGEVQRVEVERQPTKWEAFCEVCGYILLALVALAIVWLVLRITLRR
jgi:hypothetical protein